MFGREIALALLLATPAVANAAREHGTTPALGIDTTVGIGEVLWEEYSFDGQAGVIIKTAVQANWGSLEVVDLPPGAPLGIIRDKKLKACQSSSVVMGMKIWEDCLIDLDDDGRFDRVSFNDRGGSKELDPPVAYERATVEVKGDQLAGAGSNFRKQLIYLGSSNSTLRISYREFKNDLARPAFTEELTIPIDGPLPQIFSVKSHIFSIRKLDGMGIHYTVLK